MAEDGLFAGFGDRLKAQRLRSGLTQQALADVVGCHQLTICHWERGARNARLSAHLAILLARALGVDAETLLTGQDGRRATGNKELR